MATSILSIPSKNLESPTTWGQRAQIKQMLEKIWKNYGTFIKFASENSKIPYCVLASFIAVESGGNSTAGSAGHITQGLMQWNRTYAKSQLENELKKNRMTPAEKAKLAEFGITFNSEGKCREITNSDQLKPELNVLIGSIILGQLFDTDWGTDAGLSRIDRVISVYNAGAYGDTGKKARLGKHSTPYLLAQDVNSTTKAYIQKILGKNGAMDVCMTDLQFTIK